LKQREGMAVRISRDGDIEGSLGAVNRNLEWIFSMLRKLIYRQLKVPKCYYAATKLILNKYSISSRVNRSLTVKREMVSV
jgi:hypothetical protein